MTGTFRTALKLTGLGILIYTALQLHIWINKPSYRFTLYRLQMLCVLQTVMSYGSFYLYRTYSVSAIWKKLVITTIILCHFSFPALYLFVGEDPSLLSMIPALGASLQIFLFIGTLSGDVGTFLFIPFTIKISIAYQKFKINFVPIVAILLTTWSYINTVLPPQHNTIRVPIKHLGPGLNNLHIIHLSDIHVGPTTGKSYVDWLVEEVNQHSPDMVVISGDLVDSSVKNLRTAVWNLKNLKSKYGTFYVTGNHEYYTNDVDNWLKYLRDHLLIKTLHNQNHLIEAGESTLCVAGVDDVQAEKMGYEGHTTDPLSAVEGCPKDTPIIMIAHQPKAAQITIKSLPRVDLILSGHTHGGQFFPIHIPIYLVNPFFAGLYHPYPDTHVYVSRGLRYYGFPIRFLSSPEYTSIYLYTRQE